MSRRPINLASSPFRNERLPSLLFGLGLLALLAITVQHAVVIRRLLPDRTAARHVEAAGLERGLASLRADAMRLRGPGPDKTALARWVALKELVDRRTFAWTGLLARLEGVLPRGVRLVAIQPSWQKGELRVDLEAVARTSEEGLSLVKALEGRSEFEDIYPLKRSVDEGKGDVDFHYSMRYRPSAAPFTEQPATAAPVEDEESGT